MAALLIFGASRGTGAEVVNQALAEGLSCVAVVRNDACAATLAARGVTTLVGDANDSHIVADACQCAGKDCTIVSTLGGPHANYHAQMTIIDQAEQAGIGRMIMVTSLGCGDSWSTLSDRAKAAFGLAVRQKTLAEVWLQTSQLDYCIFRPGGLVDAPATGNAQCYVQQEVHGYITRSDLAALIVTQHKQSALQHQIFSVVDPDMVIDRNYAKSE